MAELSLSYNKNIFYSGGNGLMRGLTAHAGHAVKIRLIH